MKKTKKIYAIALALACALTATLRAQNLYVEDGTIGEYGLDGSTVNASLVSGLEDPSGLAISGNDLFVANGHDDFIGEYITSGATVNSDLITLPGVYDLAISGNDLFAEQANYPNLGEGSIGEYGLDGSTVNASLITGLTTPTGFVISGNDLFIANYSAGTVGEYTTSGATVNASLITGLNGPEGIAISGNNLFIVNNGNGSGGSVGEYTTSGDTVNASLITGLGDPWNIAINPVPEPSTIALAGLGAAALCLWRRRIERSYLRE